MSPDSPAHRPRPVIDHENEFFWDGIRAGELRIQQCNSCSGLVHPPRPCCASCGSFDMGYSAVSGHGRVYSHVTVHRPLVPPFAEPYTVIVVALDEGIRFVSQLVDAATDVWIGLRVKVEFTEVEEGLVLPLFRVVDEER